MKIQVSIGDKELKEMIRAKIREEIAQNIPEDEIDIRVKSKQNYRENEWEHGSVQATVYINT